MRRHLLWLMLVAVAAPAYAGAFLPEDAVDAETLLGPPPAAGSAAHDTQMAIVLWLQQTRTPEQIAFVQEDLDLARFAPLVAAELVAVDGRALKSMLDAVIDEVRTDYDKLKQVFDEPRPFQVDDAVHPVSDPRPVASYPSGHAIRATVYARLLAEVFPGHADALGALGRQIGYGRVIAGVHYPVDVTAGQKLGNAYADVIVTQPAFHEALQQIRAAPPAAAD